MALSAAMMTTELGGRVSPAFRRREEPDPASDPGREERVARIKAESEARRQRRRGRMASHVKSGRTNNALTHGTRAGATVSR
jgi:hypothetical protein